MTSSHRYNLLSLCCLLSMSSAGLYAAPPTSEQDIGASIGYQDRIIAASDLPKLSTTDQARVDSSGLPRSLHLEWLSNYSRFDQQDRLEHGLSIRRFWQTEQLGEFSLDAVGLYRQPTATEVNAELDDAWQGRFTLWQRHFFISDHWRSNNGLGVLTTPLTPLLQRPTRIFLPTIGFLGVTSQLQQHTPQIAQQTQLQFSAGQSGQLNGRQVAGFERQHGEVYAFNAEWDLPLADWRAGLAFLQNDSTSQILSSPQHSDGAKTVRSALAVTGWQNQQQSINATVLHSESVSGQTLGFWTDAQHRQDRLSHQYGWYYLQPDLNWGGVPMQQDAQGGYYRLNYQYARWLWNGGIDYLQSVTDQRQDGIYATGFARYQANSRTGYGISSSVRQSGQDHASTQQLFVDRRHPWGQTRLQLDYADAPAQAYQNQQISLDHALALQQGQRLSTAISYQQTRQSAQQTDVVNVAAYGGVRLTDRLSLDGSANWSSSLDQPKRRVTNLNITANWQLSPHWHLSSTLYQNQLALSQALQLDPLQPQLINMKQRQDDQAILLRLSYQQRGGTVASVIGGLAGATTATGSIRGSVFLDENRDGVRSASEQPASQVTVLLNDRYAVQTNERGEFEFAAVAVGSYQLRVIADNLPLPWYLSEGAETRQVEIKLRQPAMVDFGAVRMP